MSQYFWKIGRCLGVHLESKTGQFSSLAIKLLGFFFCSTRKTISCYREKVVQDKKIKKMNYIQFIQESEFRVFAEIVFGESDINKINQTVDWIKAKGALRIKTYEVFEIGAGKRHVIKFWHPSHEFYKLLHAHRPRPGYESSPTPSPVEESSVIQDKFLWRQIVRPIVGQEGTPVELNASHLPQLKEALGNLYEFTTSSYSRGRLSAFAISESEIRPGLETLIGKIERLGSCMVID
jgi:hypothetical protein